MSNVRDADDSPLRLQPWPVRLLPGDDLRRALEDCVAAQGQTAAFVLAGVGSLRPTRLRLAGVETALDLDDDLELLTLSGTIASHGSHLHLSVADASGCVVGGHVAYGCIVRTTAEVLLALLPGRDFSRELDARTASFPDLAAWDPGYAPMLSALLAGQRHSPEAADKQGQRPLAATGCAYADAHLIPALEMTGRYVDQELFAL